MRGTSVLVHLGCVHRQAVLRKEQGATIMWYADRSLVRQLPMALRVYAAAERMFPRSLPGRGRLIVHVRRLAQLAHRYLESGRLCPLFLSGRILTIDLLDGRLPLVLEENVEGGFVVRILRSVLCPGDSFVDVGANHGSYAVLAGTLVGPRGQVHCFEVQPRLLEALTLSREKNALGNMQIHAVAISDSSGVAPFFIPRVSSGIAGLHADFSAKGPASRIEVCVDTLDAVLARAVLPGSLIIKVDTEGNEDRVLRGAEALLRRYRPLLLIELNPITAKAAGTSTAAIVADLLANGYTHAVDEHRPNVVQRVSELHVGWQRNVLLGTIDRRDALHRVAEAGIHG